MNCKLSPRCQDFFDEELGSIEQQLVILSTKCNPSKQLYRDIVNTYDTFVRLRKQNQNCVCVVDTV